MTLPSVELCGVNGTNRDPDLAHLQISAVNDLEAVRSFLDEFKYSPNTQRFYTKECERMLLWAIVEKRKAFSSLTKDDLAEYIEFLKDPQPTDRWVGPKTDRNSKSWRPFEKRPSKNGLSPSSVTSATSAIDSLFKYLTDAGYLMRNPMRLIRQRNHMIHKAGGRQTSITEGDAIAAAHQAIVQGAPRLAVERFLDEDMRNAVYQVIDSMPQDTSGARFHYERVRFIVKFMFLVAPRGGELVASCMNNFQDLQGYWYWVSVRKGGKVKSVAMPGEMLQTLRRWRVFLEMPPLPSRHDAAPAVPSFRDRNKHFSLRRLNQIIKEVVFKAAEILRQDPNKVAKADKLCAVSSHWGRHTGITLMAQSGMDNHYTQLDAGHEDPRTTQIYTHDEVQRRHQEAHKRGTGWK